MQLPSASAELAVPISRRTTASLAVAVSAILAGLAAVAALPILVYAELSALYQCDFVGSCTRASGSPMETLMRVNGLLGYWLIVAPIVATLLGFSVGFGGFAIGRRALGNRAIALHVPIALSLVSLVGTLLLYFGTLGLVAAALFLLVALIIVTSHPAIGAPPSP